MRIPQSPPNPHALLGERLAELTTTYEQDDYRVFVQEAHEKHWHWNRLRFIARHRGLDPELAWLRIAFERSSQYKILPYLTDKNALQLRLVTTSGMLRDMMLIDQRLAGRINFSGGRLSETEGERAVHASLQEEAITSSML